MVVGPVVAIQEPSVEPGRLMDVAGQHEVGLEALHPTGEVGVTVELGADPAHRQVGRRPVVDPDPAPGSVRAGGDPGIRLGRELRLRGGPGRSGRPTTATRSPRVTEGQRRVVDDDSRPLEPRQPERGSLAVGIVPGQVVVPGAHRGRAAFAQGVRGSGAPPGSAPRAGRSTRRRGGLRRGRRARTPARASSSQSSWRRS